MDMGGPQGWSGRGQCAEEEKGLRKSGPVGLQSIDYWKSETVPTWSSPFRPHPHQQIETRNWGGGGDTCFTHPHVEMNARSQLEWRKGHFNIPVMNRLKANICQSPDQQGDPAL